MRGTYVLLLDILKTIDVNVGRLGLLHIPRGFYLYIGSAVGSLEPTCESRIRRHYAKRKKRFWHIDYLTSRHDVVIRFAEVVAENKKCECYLATTLITAFGGEAPFRNFGSSDCRCGGHLVFIPHGNVHVLHRGVKAFHRSFS